MRPNHFTLKDAGAICSLWGSRNPVGNLKKMSFQEVTEPSEITVYFTRGGEISHALHCDVRSLANGGYARRIKRWKRVRLYDSMAAISMVCGTHGAVDQLTPSCMHGVRLSDWSSIKVPPFQRSLLANLRLYRPTVGCAVFSRSHALFRRT
jgi:hypothetical protein